MSDARNPSPPEDPKKDRLSIEEAIRQVVRDEIGRPTEPTRQQQPKAIDAVWLVVVVTNVTLLLTIIPESVLKDDKLGLVLKLIPWLGSTLFVLGYAWFGSQILNLTRQRGFKIAQLAILVILSTVAVSRLQLFTIYPRIEPQDLILVVDNEPVHPDDNGSIKVSLRQHQITITDDSDRDENQVANTRSFDLTLSEALRAWRDSNYHPHWPLLYTMEITADTPLEELEIQKLDNNFDADFWAKPIPTKGGISPVRGQAQNILLFKPKPDTLAVFLRLPYGRYKVISRKSGCSDTEEHPSTELKKGNAGVKFTKALCANAASH